LKLIRPVRSAFVRSVIGLSAPLVIAASVLEVNPIIDRTMAGGLKVGSVTRLELGMRLLPTGLFSALVLAPLTATWAARKAQGGWPAIQESLRKALTLVALVVPPIVVIGIILRDQAVTLAYHGGAFSPQAAAQTSAVFAMFVVGLPAIVLSITFTTLFIVQRETRIPMRIAFANVILNVGLNFAFRPLFGVAGIALSTSVTFGILVVAQAIVAQRRWGSFLPPSLLASLIRIGGSLAIATVAALAVRHFLPSGASRLDALGVAAAVAGVELLVYAAALLVTHGRVTRTPGSFLQFQSRLETRA
jgi:putative peptidoglycan lipid II flippase